MKKVFLAITLLAVAMSSAGQHKQRFDAANPDVHDPVMARGENGRYYIFSTGMGVGVMSSADMKTWQREKPVFAEAPEWAVDTVKGYRGHTWAPDIFYADGLWHLYYSCSTFGKNGSAIGLAVNRTLDPTSPDFGWVDSGPVIVSHRGRDNWNAIDPNVAVDGSGKPWMVYGSFWDGIQLMPLSRADMRTPVAEPLTIARRLGHAVAKKDAFNPDNFTVEGGNTIEAGENAIEAPFIYKRDKYYYLFVSHDYCCRGRKSTYKTVYGRAENIYGPYVDRDGHYLDYGGGTYLFGPGPDNFGIGHCSVYDFDGKTYFISHAYSKADNGHAKLFIRPLTFTPDGWIVTPAGKE